MSKKITINTDICKGCQLCISVCPKGILNIDKSFINSRGYNPCKIINNDDCISCAMCGLICPDSAITVEK